jgi:tRNA dimethylallyltransferase
MRTGASPHAVVVAGPTASGKSGLALALAEKLRGVVINADSIQCYRDLPILTARPSAADELRASHRLYGELGPRDQTSAATWAGQAAMELAKAADAGQVPILVGGTGLYLMALMDGLSDIPPINDDIRAEARDLTARMGPSYMHRMLSERDPETAARLSVGDPQRIARAWEVLEATGQTMSWWQKQPKRPATDASFCSILLMPERDLLYDACNRRFDAMMAAGAVDQVRALLDAGIDDQAPVMRALGARELAAYILGGSTIQAATETARAATRHYAKRQTTWFRNQFNASLTINSQFSESFVIDIFNKIDESLLTRAGRND